MRSKKTYSKKSGYKSGKSNYSKQSNYSGKKKYSGKKTTHSPIKVNYKQLQENKFVIIVEKPSVARQFAKAFNLKGKENIEGITVFKGKYKNYELIVVPLAGHVLELDFNEGGKWTIPLIPPEQIKFKPAYGKTKFLKVLKKLISDAKVVFATDWDREGELISYEVYHYLKVPPERHYRMTYSSLQPKELKQSFERAIKKNQKIDWNLAYAGLLRAYLDKLYGFNYTRLFTLAVKNVSRDNKVWSIGRVQTPTLRLLYEREVKIEKFYPVPVLKIKLIGDYAKLKQDGDRKYLVRVRSKEPEEFISEGIQLPSTYLKETDPEKFEQVKEKFILALKVLNILGYILVLKTGTITLEVTVKTPHIEEIMEHIKTKSDALKKLKLRRLSKKEIPIPIEVTKNREHEKPPRLYSTTIALSELSRALKMKSTDVMKNLQKMYEMAVISYIRTDSEKFDEKKYREEFHKDRLSTLSKLQPYGSYISKITNYMPRNRGSKIDDAHPPIHPVSTSISGLTAVQKKMYDMIVRRYIASFYPDFVQDKLRVKLKLPIDFSKTFTKIVDPGWKEVTDPKIRIRMKKEGKLPNFEGITHFIPGNVAILFDETKPPERFTTANIIKKMEEMKLGTKSTRAQIIQTLMNRGYITVNNKNQIRVTQKGKEVIMLIDNIDDEHIQLISKPEFTAHLEDKMDSVNKGKEDYKNIIQENIEIIKNVTHDKKKKITKAYLTLSSK